LFRAAIPALYSLSERSVIVPSKFMEELLEVVIITSLIAYVSVYPKFDDRPYEICTVDILL